MSAPIKNSDTRMPWEKPSTPKWDFSDYPRSQPTYKPYGDWEPKPDMSKPDVRRAVEETRKHLEKQAAQKKK